MGKLCKCGSGKEVKGYGRFSFSHKGFGLITTRGGSECEDCSFGKKIIVAAIDEYGDYLIIKTDANLVINWDFYLKEKSKRFSKVEFLSEILVALEILSVYSENNWEIVADGSRIINPRYYSSTLYFTKECDVKEYVKLEFPDTLWHWEIRRISQVIKKGDIIK